MNVKEAVAVAKTYVAELFQDEAAEPPTLEEVRFDEACDEWRITVGVRRGSGKFGELLRQGKILVPDYKVVRISDQNGEVKGLAIREPGVF